MLAMVAIAADSLLIPVAAVDLDTIAPYSLLIAADAVVALPDAVVEPVLPDATALPDVAAAALPDAVALAAPPPRRACEASSESEPDSCRISFRASRDVYFFPAVSAQNTCNFSRLTGHPNSKFCCGLEKNYGL